MTAALRAARTDAGAVSVKGIVHRKIKMNSSSTHQYFDGGVGEVSESTKHFWSFRGKLRCSQIAPAAGVHFFKPKKTTEETHKTPPFNVSTRLLCMWVC